MLAGGDLCCGIQLVGTSICTTYILPIYRYDDGRHHYTAAVVDTILII